MLKHSIFFTLAVIVSYLLFWPTPINPIAWQAPTAPPMSSDNRLSSVEIIALPDYGPEDLTLASNGRLYSSSASGAIYQITGIETRKIADTGGRPLGIEWSEAHQTLLVADALLGLLSVTVDGEVKLLSNNVNGSPIRYADDVDVTSEGIVYFSDASTKFTAIEHGSYEASLLDIMEHGANGRLLKYDFNTGETSVALESLHFANGVTVSFDERSVLVVETSKYRVLRYWINGPNAGQTEVFIDNLPGFPDNINRNTDGNYWIGLVSPRNSLLDGLSEHPFWRQVIQRLPSWMRPKAERFGQVIAVNEAGQLVDHWADQNARYGFITGALIDGDWMYLSSLHEDSLARVKTSDQGE
ncbi:MAG: strictosidine synthase family protein [Gammaproteobacteria bacterium]|nr:strictosidine synthase family protein [Gammaproteobacteria bacterium]